MESPFILTYTYKPHQNDPGQGEKVRSYDYYAEALSQYRRMRKLPELYGNLKANFDIDEDVIADMEEKYKRVLNPKRIIR
jgi:hypothetical protein